MKSTFKCFFRRCLSTDQRPERTSASAPADLHVLHISLRYLIISSLMKYVIFQQDLTATDLIPKPHTPFFIMRPACSSAMGNKAISAAFQSPSYLLTTTGTKGKQKLTTDRQIKDQRAQIGKMQRKGRRWIQSVQKSIHISENETILLFSFRWWEIRALRSLETFCKGFLAAFKLSQGSIWGCYGKNHHPGCHSQLHVILW